MKYFVTILRILVGLLFIFSGLIKSNDPTGFSYKLDEYFSVFSADMEREQDSLRISIISEEGREDYTQVLSSKKPLIQLTVHNAPWIVIPIDEQTGLSLSTANVDEGFNRMYGVQINGEDSGTLAFSLEIIAAVNQEIITQQKVDFFSGEALNKVVEIDVSDFIYPENSLVQLFQSLREYVIPIAILICVLEILLGIALLIGWAPRFISWMLLLMILFFTFLTWYSAQFNKVTDCGCFGDAIKLSPWQSFYKDIILLVSILFILVGIRYIKPLFSKPFSIRLLTVFTILSAAFSIYCWHFLPLKNFLHFKEGNNVEAMMVCPEGAPKEIREFVFIYTKDGKDIELTMDEINKDELKAEGYTFKDRVDKVVQEGCEPPIHDFRIMDETQTNNYIKDFFHGSRWKILLVINDVNLVNEKAIPEVKELCNKWLEAGYEVYPLTASSVEEVEAFRHRHQLDLPFYWGDKTNLKSIIRSNPGLLLFDGSSVVETWPSTRLPKAKKLLDYTKTK